MTKAEFEEFQFQNEMRLLARALAPFIPPKPPKAPKALLTGEEGNMLNYKIVFPETTASDVVAWDLSATVNGAPESIMPATPDTVLSYAEGDVVVWKLRQVDDATPPNVSDWSPEFTFTAADTIAPPAPGAPGAELVSED